MVDISSLSSLFDVTHPAVVRSAASDQLSFSIVIWPAAAKEARAVHNVVVLSR